MRQHVSSKRRQHNSNLYRDKVQEQAQLQSVNSLSVSFLALPLSRFRAEYPGSFCRQVAVHIAPLLRLVAINWMQYFVAMSVAGVDLPFSTTVIY